MSYVCGYMAEEPMFLVWSYEQGVVLVEITYKMSLKANLLLYYSSSYK